MDDCIGLYIHIPYCKSKCAYCDFFSGKGSENEFDNYTEALIKSLSGWSARINRSVSSVYFGGGTPSILGDSRLSGLLDHIKSVFNVNDSAEITLEINPESGKSLDFKRLKTAGFNRLSIGLQSADENELKTLGRIHTPNEAAQTVSMARTAGFTNISLDLMLGIPMQTKESLKKSIDFCLGCGVTHLSSYLLKIEKGTRFYSYKEQLQLPDEDEQAKLYLFAVDYLNKHGLEQYEISNFAVKGFESRHNTLYWRCGEYIGIGPSAHSFYNGRRFYYERDMQSFLDDKLVDSGEGGTEEEYIMLALRLKTGLVFSDYEQRFNKPLSPAFMKKTEIYAKNGFMYKDDTHVCFTPKGFLVSNTIISDLI